MAYYSIKIADEERFLVSGALTAAIYASHFARSDGQIVGMEGWEESSIEEWAFRMLVKEKGFALRSSKTNREFAVTHYGDPAL